MQERKRAGKRWQHHHIEDGDDDYDDNDDDDCDDDGDVADYPAMSFVFVC